MQILSVTLTNFKAHRDRHFQFQPGTNAICGENGAGKTSILEAIAWVLFNYKGSYNNSDLVRNGAGSAEAMVEFISSQDSRTYQVKRSTSTGYILYDPQLGERLPYSRIEDEVMPWLREHMGVAPGVDLSKLFANTIGIPQGTFTADFLKPKSDRKRVFDVILKVEEYQQVYQELNDLRKYAEAQSATLKERIAQYDETLQQWDSLQQRRQQIDTELQQQQQQLQTLQQQLETLQGKREAGLAQRQQLQTLQQRLQGLETQIHHQTQHQRRLEQSVRQGQEAVQICETNREAHRLYQEATAKLRQLDQRQQQRQQVWQQRETYRQQQRDRDQELTRLKLQLETFARMEQDVAQLADQVQQQQHLDQQIAEVNQTLQQLQALKLEAQTLAQQVAQLDQQEQGIQTELQRLEALNPQVQAIPNLEEQRDRIQEQLSRVEAARQFEAELQRLVAGGLADRDRYQAEAKAALQILQGLQSQLAAAAAASITTVTAAIHSGQEMTDSLLRSLQEILQDLSAQVSVPKLKQQLQTVKTRLTAAYQARAQVATREAKQQQLAELTQTRSQVQQQLAQRQQQLQAEAATQQQLAKLTAALAQLQDPQGRSRFLTQQLRQRDTVQRQYDQLQQAATQLQQGMAQVEARLEEFAGLDADIATQKQQQQQQQPGYLQYLQHEKVAQTLAQLQGEQQTAIAQLQKLQTEQAQATAEHRQLAETFDEAALAELEQTYSDTKSQADRITGSLPQQRNLLAELGRQLAALQATADKRDQTQKMLERRDRVEQFINFARDIYKKAGPRITQLYLHEVSWEADRLFRDLLNRPNVALKWKQDYEIIVQEGPHERRFINLSGGEQMCAALAVRLALLKVLANLDIAFFDEPTTNMDQSRRDSLADAIARIKTFRQLFVISHDNTFEKVTENVILVERDA